MIKKLLWLWKRFWGKKYYIKFTNHLKNDEVLFFSHTIYIGINDK